MLLIINFCEGAFDSIRSRPPLFTKRVRQSLIFNSALFLVTPKKEVQQNNKERKGKHRNFFFFLSSDAGWQRPKILRDINYQQCICRLHSGGAVNERWQRRKWMMKGVGLEMGNLTTLSVNRFTFTSPLSESWLLLVISCHHSAVSFATHCGHRLLLLLLLRHIKATHVYLLTVGVKIIVLLINVHVLLNVMMRGRGRHWWRRLHHLTLADILIKVHAAVAHDLTSRTELARLRHRRRLLVDEVLRSLESKVLIAWPHHESRLVGLALNGELRNLSQLVRVGWFVFDFHKRFAHFWFN